MDEGREILEREGPYRPIDCALHDRLEAAATIGRPADLAWIDAEGRETSSRETIVDVFARGGEEFLTTASPSARPAAHRAQCSRRRASSCVSCRPTTRRS